MLTYADVCCRVYWMQLQQVKADASLKHLRIEFTRGDGTVKRRELQRQQVRPNACHSTK